jgi:hypothetical protein
MQALAGQQVGLLDHCLRRRVRQHPCVRQDQVLVDSYVSLEVCLTHVLDARHSEAAGAMQTQKGGGLQKLRQC